MNAQQLAELFETHRAHLRAVAYRMLGSATEADDAVQETWLRISRADTDGVENLGGWLTTVVGRVCLDALRSRSSHREEPIDDAEVRPVDRARAPTPEEDAVLADAVGMAMMVVLDRLTPAERVAFVLHDTFDLTFDEIAPIIGRSAVAARQLASRARRRVQGTTDAPARDFERHRQLVDAFLAAARAGDFETLLSVLDPDVVVRPDAAALRLGGDTSVRGAAAVAKVFAGKARAARPGLIDGEVGVIVDPHGKLLLILALTFSGGRITEIEAVADKASLRELTLQSL